MHAIQHKSYIFVSGLERFFSHKAATFYLLVVMLVAVAVNAVDNKWNGQFSEKEEIIHPNFFKRWGWKRPRSRRPGQRFPVRRRLLVHHDVVRQKAHELYML